MGSAVTSEATKAPAKAVNPPWGESRFQLSSPPISPISGPRDRGPHQSAVVCHRFSSAALPEQLATVSIFLWRGLAFGMQP